MSEPSSDPLIQFLGKLDRGAKATLRRSLAFSPGRYPDAMPYVERFVRGQPQWNRTVAYLVAGLMASSKAEAPHGNVGEASLALRVKTDSRSVESRFIALLDADEEQLPHRLRQMITLMSGHDIAPGWAQLRTDLEQWKREDRRIQQRWAVSFYAYDAEPKDQEPDVLTGAEDAETEA